MDAQCQHTAVRCAAGGLLHFVMRHDLPGMVAVTGRAKFDLLRARVLHPNRGSRRSARRLARSRALRRRMLALGAPGAPRRSPADQARSSRRAPVRPPARSGAASSASGRRSPVRASASPIARRERRQGLGTVRAATTARLPPPRCRRTRSPPCQPAVEPAQTCLQMMPANSQIDSVRFARPRSIVPALSALVVALTPFGQPRPSRGLRQVIAL